ncbi:hypothetical protein MNB_SV-14-37 [hydrothermal vent metagenome]|uniref:Uncharacterized protein n=1 Tax=hydrothermal vent metagenome TaxID=652676 RepID=A0A1W1CVD6_9ZZZZ
MYKIDITQKKVVKTITLSQSVRFWDMAIDLSGNYFYAMLIQDGDDDSDFNNYKFAKIKISDGTITTIGKSHDDLSSYISLIFSDASGKIIALSQDGKLYEIMPQSGKTYFTRPFANLSYYNDGTSCPDANITLPPHPPRLSINNVTKAEGNSGKTIFNFTVTADKPFDMMPMSGAMFYYEVVDGNGSVVVPPHGVAHHDDHDFQLQQGIKMDMRMFSNEVSINLPVTVYGDKKIEKDEEFFVEIYSPQIPMGMNPKYIIGVGVILNDDFIFNIERTNSQNDTNQTQKESLYTQIAGRDFDYSIVSYDSNNSELNIKNMLFKIELLDMNSTEENNILYKHYYYTGEEEANRFPIEIDNDLIIDKATRDARFKISYIANVNSTKVSEFNKYEDAYESLKNDANYTKGSSFSRDNFAIRPADYRIDVEDINGSNSTIVAEHDYNLTVIATKYNSQEKVLNYKQTKNEELNASLVFEGNSACNNKNEHRFNYKFSDGNLTNTLSHNNYGKYRLNIVDNNWTAVDMSNQGCILNSNSISADGNSKSGCNISSDINMSFQPYSFVIENSFSNIHNAKDYLYMSDLSLSKAMGAKLSSTIKAVGENNTTLSNFTNSCIKNNPTFTAKLRFSFEDDRGTWSDSNMTLPQSVTKKPLSPQQVVAFNDENISDKSTTIIGDITFNKNKFKDDKNGTVKLEILYNMRKLFTEPTNPIKVDFKSLELNTTNLDLDAIIDEKNNTPKGSGKIDKNRTFYFARVSSYSDNYPETAKKSINTPLFVEIFCRTHESNQSWCRDTMNMKNIAKRIGQKTYRGWYLAYNHDSSTEGNINKITSQHNDISTNYTTTIPPFIHGKIDDIRTFYNKSGDLSESIRAKIVIDTDEWLKFNREDISGKPYYIINMKSLSSTTGAGDTGNQIESVKKVEHNGKMSW